MSQTAQDVDAAGEEPRARSIGPWVTAVRKGTGFGAVALAGYLVVTLCAWQLGARPASFGAMFGAWVQWDAWWYFDIATHGYPTGAEVSPAVAAGSPAFYPLYPLVIRAFDLVLPGGVQLAGFAASLATFLGLLVILYRFLDSEFEDKALVDRVVWYLLLFPTAFFLAAPYPMSLFLLLALASIYCMRRGNWFGAAVVAGLATASRGSALLLLVLYALEYLRQHDWSIRRLRPDAAWILLIPSGLLAYLAYCQVVRGDYRAPFAAQRDYFQHRLDWPWVGTLRVARYVGGHLVPDFTLYPVLDLGLIALMAALLVGAVVGPFRLRQDQWPLVAFGAGALLFAISFPMPDVDPIKGASRYVLEIVPAFMVLGQVGARQWLDRAYVAVALPLQALLLVIHLHTGWVA